MPRSEVGRGASYACPACRAPLVLRAGTIKSKHLSHKPSGTCTPETVLHVTAKLLLERALLGWLAGKAEITCHRSCDDCGASMPFQLPRSRADSVAVEQRLACGRIPDVSLMLAGECTLAIEVFVTHAVDDDKAAALPVHWIELDADAVLDDPNNWRPRRARLREARCTECARLAARFEQDYGTPGGAFQRQPRVPCYRCGRPIHWFSWAGHAPCSRDEPPAQGRPRTLKLRHSNTAGHAYWMNTCPHCGAKQGDVPLYSGLDGDVALAKVDASTIAERMGLTTR